MEEHQIGWIAAIIIDGIAGWLAEPLHAGPLPVPRNDNAASVRNVRF